MNQEFTTVERTTAPTVFLSHASTDKVQVREIRRALAPFGNRLWLDELELLPGDSLFGRIGRQIESSDRVLAFISRASVDSRWVQRELNSCLAREADLNKTMVIPVVIDSVPVPVFLNDRLQVRLPDLSVARATQAILKGLFGHQGVLIAEPSTTDTFGLKPLRDSIADCRDLALNGELKIVFDHNDLSRIALSALIQDEWGQKDRTELAWPRCLHLLSSLAPRIVHLVHRYYAGDVGAPAVADSTLQTIWRLVMLSLLDRIKHGGNIEHAISQSRNIFGPAFAELDELQTATPKRVPDNVWIGILGQLWLKYLDTTYDDCLEIGFRGSETTDGPKIFDAGHVLIRKCDVRPTSLTTYHDTTPDAEFPWARWVKHVLPYITADAILQVGFGGRELEDAVPRIGLGKEEFCSFGLE